VIDAMKKAIERMNSLGAEFCDIRMQSVSTTGIQSINGDIRQLTMKKLGGICVRAWRDGRWGYGTVSSFSEKDMMKAAEDAVRNASGIKRNGIRIDPPSVRKKTAQAVRIHPGDIDLKEKISAVLDADGAQTGNDVINRIGSYSEDIRKNTMVNSAGSEIEWDEIRTRFRAMSVASDGTRTERYYDGPDGTAGFELVRGTDIEALGRNTASEAVAALKAERAPSGPLTVITDPMMSGLLAHEVMGHASEADEVVKKRSFLTDAVGKKVASSVISMFDDGTVKGAHGSIPYDDEGTPSSKTQIIKDGVYTGYMHNLETAAAMNTAATGNGRAEDFGKRVWARMTNTYFGPGDRTLDDMIADTKYGVLTDKMVNGMEDPVAGGFEAKALRGFLIENGRITKLLSSFTLTGRALEILQTTDAASKDVVLDGGMCGKGIEDWVNVSSGGPYCRSRIILGGG